MVYCTQQVCKVDENNDKIWKFHIEDATLAHTHNLYNVQVHVGHTRIM